MSNLFIFYDSNKRGTFTYDGTVGPWASLPATQASASLKALADFMAGRSRRQHRARQHASRLLQNSFDLFVQDAWTVSSNVTLNFGAALHLSGRARRERRDADQLPARTGDGLDRASVSGGQEGLLAARRRRLRPGTARKTVIRGAYGALLRSCSP